MLIHTIDPLDCLRPRPTPIQQSLPIQMNHMTAPKPKEGPPIQPTNTAMKMEPPPTMQAPPK